MSISSVSIYSPQHQHVDFRNSLVLPDILEFLPPAPAAVLDAGCGNGALTAILADKGYSAIGIDVGESVVQLARQQHPSIPFHAVDLLGGDLTNILPPGGVDAVVACEVIEHLYIPGQFVSQMRRVLRPGGVIVITTPYHGYVKNLALSVANRWDFHLSPNWDGGHIKFFSRNTLSELMTKHGFKNLRFRGAGRVPYLWKSMVMVGTN